MRAKTNTITINGRTYDAATGRPVIAHATKSTKHVTKAHQPQLIQPTVQKPAAASTRKIRVSDRSEKGTVTVRVAGRQPERSHTLMRKAVQKPTVKKSAHTVSGLVSQPSRTVFHKGSADARHERALSHAKSEAVHKFAPHQSVSKITATIPVAQAPRHSAPKKISYDITNVPPAPTVHTSRQPLQELHRDLFETAIQDAVSHKAKKYVAPKRHRKVARLTLTAASLALLIGFFAYQNASSIALKRASSTIGFTAAIPAYQPSGFRTGPVEYEPGKVTINFRSNSDSRAYTVTQANTYFDNQSLQNGYLQGKSYETIQNNDQVSFFYGNANLTWVRNGIWYNIQGNSQLSREQLFKVASSLF